MVQKGTPTSIEKACKRIKKALDTPNSKKPDHRKISLLFACNASGKTRLSKLFYDNNKEQVLYYNAFTEDLFSWDNDDYTLKIDANTPMFKLIKDQGIDRQIIDNFKKFTGSKIEPVFDFPQGQIRFGIYLGDDKNVENIKISRGEESVFIWSIFYTILETAIDALDQNAEDRSINIFDRIEYIVIDDPVSSMDDTRIITIAIALAELIKNSKNKLKFLITTHHALFFNVLFNTRMKNWDKKNYILSRSGADIHLKTQGSDSPFAYHHVIKSEIEDAINAKDLKKYHFNLFRALLEKTANFLGHNNWNECLPEIESKKVFIKILNHYSHDKSSDLESKDLPKEDKDAFEEAFDSFLKKYKWGNA